MSASDAFEALLANLIFLNTNAANIGDATGLRGSSTAGSLYISLHTADPGETGNQSTNEIGYTSYARVAVARSGAGFTVTGTAPTTVSNTAAVGFPASTGANATATHFGIGTGSSGAGTLLLSGALTASYLTQTGIAPNFPIGALTATID